MHERNDMFKKKLLNVVVVEIIGGLCDYLCDSKDLCMGLVLVVLLFILY